VEFCDLGRPVVAGGAFVGIWRRTERERWFLWVGLLVDFVRLSRFFLGWSGVFPVTSPPFADSLHVVIEHSPGFVRERRARAIRGIWPPLPRVHHAAAAPMADHVDLSARKERAGRMPRPPTREGGKGGKRREREGERRGKSVKEGRGEGKSLARHDHENVYVTVIPVADAGPAFTGGGEWCHLKAAAQVDARPVDHQRRAGDDPFHLRKRLPPGNLAHGAGVGPPREGERGKEREKKREEERNSLVVAGWGVGGGTQLARHFVGRRFGAWVWGKKRIVAGQTQRAYIQNPGPGTHGFWFGSSQRAPGRVVNRR